MRYNNILVAATNIGVYADCEDDVDRTMSTLPDSFFFISLVESLLKLFKMLLVLSKTPLVREFDRLRVLRGEEGSVLVITGVCAPNRFLSELHSVGAT